ncbi:hypothetical protein Agabi119p4_2873 [Agaricus bisporus var. burnettii]|uniref:Phosducin domain-containing protein n=1 Tax=Agaricus bisporus var. burnettii TaxID=192524 RepID=A0A8H7F611_AGABI|nr:hypothetical protein Agabi119p4_2873 [Agaricus bisporus var. burnettii]
MPADLEALVLSGELFNGRERSPSPPRSDSSSVSGWHDEELQYKRNNEELRKGDAKESVGMGPGRTGVKGVIRDRDEAVEMERNKNAKEMENLRNKMAAGNLGGKTYLEEEREKVARGEDQFDELVLKELEKDLAKRDVFGAPRARFGYLREVGVKQFVDAVEREGRGVWVVIHIYDPSLERCFELDDLLARVAKENPATKFLRARATALGFAKVNKSRTKLRSSKRQLQTYEEDYDDIFDDDEEEDGDSEDQDDENVDLEMLPTILVYRDGELVHNWVRVDWVAGEEGVGELFRNQNIIQSNVIQQVLEIDHPESDDPDFQDSLRRIIARSNKDDDDSDW